MMTTTSSSQAALSANAFSGNGLETAGDGGGGGNETGSGGNNGEQHMSAAVRSADGGGAKPGSSTNHSNNATQANSNASQRVSDVGKRKKLKSRNASAPSTNYSKDHLDAWLETCLKDASNTQLSSSSEFLDYNPSLAKNKAAFPKHQQQPQTTLQQQQHPHSHSSSTQQLFYSHSQSTNPTQPPHQHHQQQQTFAGRSNQLQSQSSMFPYGQQAPFSLGFQKSMPNFMKSSPSFGNRQSLLYPTSSQLCQQLDGSQDFASLPPIVNMLGGSMEQEQNSTDVLDGSSSNPNISRGFRFSDPCLLNPSDNDSKISGHNTPDRRNYLPSEMENNKFFAALMEQIQLLHESNTKICRNLHETKVDIEALKHAPNWGLRHRRDSLSGLSTHSQPMVFGGGFGTQSPALTYHSGAYTPGMMTDVVREVKEAARIREDALLSRVKAMVEERQWSLNEGSLRMMRDIEELKSQIQHLRADRKESNKRITHLEAENKYMRQMLGTLFHSRNSSRDIIYENEAFRPRSKNFAPSRRSNSLNLHYGTIHHQPAQSSYSLEEQEENVFNTNETPSTASTADIGSVNVPKPRPADFRSSFSSSEGGGGGSGGSGGVAGCNDSNGETLAVQQNSSGTTNGSACEITGLLSPPKFALVSTPADEHKRPRSKQAKKEEGAFAAEREELRRELSDAVAANNQADERIIALENLVRSLQVSIANSLPPRSSSASAATFSNGVGAAGNGFTVAGVGYSLKLQQASSALARPQHQLLHQPHTTASTTSIGSAHAPPKLSVAGPITDL